MFPNMFFAGTRLCNLESQQTIQRNQVVNITICKPSPPRWVRLEQPWPPWPGKEQSTNPLALTKKPPTLKVGRFRGDVGHQPKQCTTGWRFRNPENKGWYIVSITLLQDFWTISSYITNPNNVLCLFREIPQNCHTFAVFDPPKKGNLMPPEMSKSECLAIWDSGMVNRSTHNYITLILMYVESLPKLLFIGKHTHVKWIKNLGLCINRHGHRGWDFP